MRTEQGIIKKKRFKKSDRNVSDVKQACVIAVECTKRPAACHTPFGGHLRQLANEGVGGR